MVSIKHPVLHIAFHSTNGNIIWWEEGNWELHYFDDLPGNYPRWEHGTLDTVEEIREAYARLKTSGGELIEDNVEEWLKAYEGDE